MGPFGLAASSLDALASETKKAKNKEHEKKHAFKLFQTYQTFKQSLPTKGSSCSLL